MGASGSGTTTLGQALAQAMSFKHLDTDHYYWLPTHPPYQAKRLFAERQALLMADIQAGVDVVVSGSLLGWGDEIEHAFDLIVFLYLPARIRLARLHQREMARNGAADPAFLAWAAQYDAGTAEGRSLAKHRAWLAERTCQLLLLDQDLTVAERVTCVISAISDVPQPQAVIGGHFH